MVPKNVAARDIINTFQKYNLDISEVPYYKIGGLEESYKFYSTNGHCDCGSTISKLQNENVNSFDRYKIKKKDEDIKKLNRMKKLKSSKDYEERAKAFQAKNDYLLELARNLNGKEYKSDYKDFEDFINENSDLNDSIYTNIEEFEKEINEYNFNDFIYEFNNLKNICSEILKLADEICIFPFWQAGEVIEIENKKEVTFENLSINDLVFLPYKNLLKVISFK